MKPNESDVIFTAPETKRINFNVPLALHAEFRTWCFRNGQSMSEAATKIISDYLQRMGDAGHYFVLPIDGGYSEDLRFYKVEKDVDFPVNPKEQEQAAFEWGSDNGYIYIAGIEEDDSLCKIGKSKDVPRRVKELTKGPYTLRLIHSFPAGDMGMVETFLHKMFLPDRRRGEWFNLDSESIGWLESIHYASSSIFSGFALFMPPN